ncbi:MAG: universal stress protein [Deltaproteobacteria bacterium]|nr:universal stress protein [Deltaproteobacteria bacterium]
MQIKRILVPVDFSEASESALRESVDLAQLLGAEITAVHVIEPPLAPLAGSTFVMPPSFGDVTAILRQRLEELVQRSSGHGVRLHAVLAEGVPYVEIVRIAKDHDLIVMSTQGRTGLAHLLLGSVAERIVRTSTIPVLTLRAPTTSK